MNIKVNKSIKLSAKFVNAADQIIPCPNKIIWYVSDHTKGNLIVHNSTHEALFRTTDRPGNVSIVVQDESCEYVGSVNFKVFNEDSSEVSHTLTTVVILLHKKKIK